MIDDTILSKKRIFKSPPEYLKCKVLFEKQNKLTVDEFIEMYQETFKSNITRTQAFARIHRLKMHGHINHIGLKVYKLNKKSPRD